MVFIKTKINVKFDSIYENDAIRLIKLIRGNPEVFELLCSENVYLDTDLETFLKNVFNDFFKFSMNDENNIIFSALLYLIEDCFSGEMEFDESEQIILKIIIIGNYYLLKKNVSLEKCITDYENIKMDMLNTLNEKYRFMLLNKLLQRVFDEPETKFWLDNDAILDKICAGFLEDVSEEENNNEDKLPILNNNVLNSYVREFLNKVEPSGRWIKLYNKLVKSGKIHSVQVGEEWEYVKNGKNEYINAPFEYNIADFPRIIHEFMHYIGALRFPTNYSTNYYSDEVASIYYENLANLFLTSKGYNKKQLEMLNQERLQNTVLVCDTLRTILFYLKIYLQKACVDKDDIVYEGVYNSVEEAVDDINKLFVLYSQTLTVGSLYIFGQFFSKEAMKKNVDMVNFTENSKFMLLTDVLDFFGLDRDMFIISDEQRT